MGLAAFTRSAGERREALALLSCFLIQVTFATLVFG